VKSKETYNLVHLLVYHYIFDNARLGGGESTDVNANLSFPFCKTRSS
jgi:hypothetical protein